MSSTTAETPDTALPPSVEGQPLNHEPDWEVPTSPPKRGFLSSIPLFGSSRLGANKPTTSFAQDDTEYHGASKETGALGAGAGGAAVGGGLAASGRRNGLGARFNNMMPAHRKYFGLSRKIFLIVVAVLGLCLLALILGLAIGLSKKKHSSSHKNLPLPSNTGVFTGDITYYDPGGPGFGACGVASYSTDPICAVSHILYDAASVSSNPNDNPLCGQMIRITRFDSTEGKNNSIDVKVVDRCVGCAADDLDLSESMFADLASVALGRVVASWAWLN